MSVRDAARNRADANALVAVKRLREMAEDVERRAEHGDFVGVIHTISWGVANLNLDAIVSAALEEAKFAGMVTGMDGGEW